MFFVKYLLRGALIQRIFEVLRDLVFPSLEIFDGDLVQSLVPGQTRSRAVFGAKCHDGKLLLSVLQKIPGV